MAYLLDTCVLSDGIKSAPSSSLLAWLSATREEDRFVSVLSLAEILFGILKLPEGRRKVALAQWYDGRLRPLYEKRILPFGESEAVEWAQLRAFHGGAALVDSQLAATALANGLTLVTRNVKDFVFGGLAVFNPWQS